MMTKENRMALSESIGTASTLVRGVSAMASNCAAILAGWDERIGTGYSPTADEAEGLQDSMDTFAHQMVMAALAVLICVGGVLFSAGVVPDGMAEIDRESPPDPAGK